MTGSDKNIHKILIVSPNWIGDAVMAQVLFKQLKVQHPNCQIDVLAPQHLHPLLERMPQINACLTLPYTHGKVNLRKTYKFARTLRAENHEPRFFFKATLKRLAQKTKKPPYAQAIILPNSFKSALIPYLAKIPIRTGFSGEMRYRLINDLRQLDPNCLPLMVERYLALAFPSNTPFPKKWDYPKLKINHAAQPALLRKFNLHLKNEAPVLALCPGAEYGPTKRWPEKYFAEIAKCKAREGWQIWLFGGVKDQSVTAEIQKLSGNVCVDLAGKTHLDEAIDLLELAKTVITNDSGLLHIAAAVGCNLIAIYGSTTTKFTPPLSNTAQSVSLNLSCAPCFQRSCPLKHQNCLINLTPKVILAKL